MDDRAREEVDRNYEAFRKRLPELLGTHRGKFALLHDAQIVEFFDTARDANAAGRQIFKGEPFSIQEVTDGQVDLGFFSHAVPHQPV